MGRHVIDKLHRAGFSLNERNWNSWIECLCRYRLFDEALAVLTVDMPLGGVKPGRNTVKTLLKFAKGTAEEPRVHDSVKRRLPELYAEATSER